MFELLIGVVIGLVLGAKFAAQIMPVIDGIWAKVKAQFASTAT